MKKPTQDELIMYSLVAISVELAIIIFAIVVAFLFPAPVSL